MCACARVAVGREETELRRLTNHDDAELRQQANAGCHHLWVGGEQPGQAWAAGDNQHRRQRHAPKAQRCANLCRELGRPVLACPQRYAGAGGHHKPQRERKHKRDGLDLGGAEEAETRVRCKLRARRQFFNQWTVPRSLHCTGRRSLPAAPQGWPARRPAAL